MKELRSLFSPGFPCLRQLRTATGSTERTEGLPICRHRQARGRCLFSSPASLRAPSPCLPHGPCTRYQCVFSLSCTFLVLFLLSYLSCCLHGHPHVPLWISLVPAPSINWREATPTHQDGSHFESRNFGLAYCRDPSHSLSHTLAILAGIISFS